MTVQNLSIVPPLDPNFVSPYLWEEAYLDKARAHPESYTALVDILRPDGSGKRIELLSLPETDEHAVDNFFRVERLIKFLLWQVGGSLVCIDGPQAWVRALGEKYQEGGERSFDNETIGRQVYGEALRFEKAALGGTEAPSLSSQDIGGHTRGNRIGFDLGGSDRKCAAVVDGEVVFSEEIPWSPYFESDSTYHIEGIRDSIERAAKHLPKIDAIGGSAAGIYINNEPRIASLFRGLSPEALENEVRPFFRNFSSEWDGVPFQIANDGDITALAGAMMLGEGEYLGISMGTSLACGYVDHDRRITSMLNELAFVPVDFQKDGPVDEWSGDAGCGVQYFSQQAVARLATKAGLSFDADMSMPVILEEVQKLAEEGNERASQIFHTIGVYLGHTLALFSQHYAIKHVLLLGRVMSGAGGEWIINQAKEVLEKEFPEIAKKIKLSVPDDRLRRHGQAIAAASLPPID
ncbi:transcriptional regulator [Coraliomargarita sinensis]|uniref:Transcriptional regulator n=1 Tax=Coraliomargarita sinensis TaxID=2174842 RepID=A0A317ZF69_9BACT|nr:ROK family protein [Coraliomargarita sinensis]PXA04165.1 transcriptional regulator [Coraliomargarita sinensis]